MLLSVLATAYLLEILGRASGAFSLTPWLALIPARILGGEVQRLLTYPLLTGGLLELIFTGILVGWIGSRVERAWSAGELLFYCGLCVLGAGLVRTALAPSGAEAVAGAPVLTLALLVAWARLFGHERLRLSSAWEIRRLHVAAVLALLVLFSAYAAAGWKHAALFAASALTGWFYLSLRWKRNQSQPAAPVRSDRIHRLEL